MSFPLPPTLAWYPGPRGGACDHFTALARVAPLPCLQGRLGALQGQGPIGAGADADYVASSLVEAEAQGASRLLLVNAAAPQVPSFAEDVARAARRVAVPMRYRDFSDWEDGGLVTPEAAASYARHLADDVEAAPGKTLLVVNCNAGLDRSGTLNALVQLVLAARQGRAAGIEPDDVVAQTVARVPQVVAALKRARPASISSHGRYVFVYRALAAALAVEPALH